MTPHTVTIALKVSSLLLVALPLNARAAEQWVVATDLWGNTNYQTLQLDVQGTQLTGTLDGDRVSGTLRAGGRLDQLVIAGHYSHHDHHDGLRLDVAGSLQAL